MLNGEIDPRIKLAGDWSFKKLATCFQVDPKIARTIFWNILEHIYKNQLAIPNFLSSTDGNEETFQQMHDSLGKTYFFFILWQGNGTNSHIIKFNLLSWIVNCNWKNTMWQTYRQKNEGNVFSMIIQQD